MLRKLDGKTGAAIGDNEHASRKTADTRLKMGQSTALPNNTRLPIIDRNARPDNDPENGTHHAHMEIQIRFIVILF